MAQVPSSVEPHPAEVRPASSGFDISQLDCPLYRRIGRRCLRLMRPLALPLLARLQSRVSSGVDASFSAQILQQLLSAQLAVNAEQRAINARLGMVADTVQLLNQKVDGLTLNVNSALAAQHSNKLFQAPAACRSAMRCWPRSPFAAPSIFDDYLGQIDVVEGWLSNTTAVISHELMHYQSHSGIRGNICEIGVHHGRYFIALATQLRFEERGVAVDLFGAQEENIDNSGCGNQPVFEANVARFVPMAKIDIIARNSASMTPDDITQHGLVRFFSIDGGHSEAMTLNDIRLAEGTICEGGIAAVDDILSSHWTGVISGVARYFGEGGALLPFAVVPNKLLLCRQEFAERYRHVSRERFAEVNVRQGAEFLGRIVDVFDELPAERLLTRAARNPEVAT
jgi:Methyltransferase domain